MVLERGGEPLRLVETTYPLEEANAALADLRAGAFRGAAILGIDH